MPIRHLLKVIALALAVVALYFAFHDPRLNPDDRMMGVFAGVFFFALFIGGFYSRAPAPAMSTGAGRGTAANKPVKDARYQLWVIVIALCSVAGAYVIGRRFELSIYATGAIGVGVFMVVFAASVKLHLYFRNRALRRYLMSLPHDRRMAALDAHYGGRLSKMMETPEYRKIETDVRETLDRRVRPMLERLQQHKGPLSFSAQNRIEADLAELREASNTTAQPTSPHTRRAAPRR